MSEEKKLPMIVELDSAKGGRGAVTLAQVPVEALRENLRGAAAMLSEAFSDLREVGGFRLSEVTIELEVGAEGGVAFIGTAKASGSGSISLKFEPPKAD